MMYENIAAKPLAAAKVLECALQGHGEYPAGVFSDTRKNILSET